MHVKQCLASGGSVLNRAEIRPYGCPADRSRSYNRVHLRFFLVDLPILIDVQLCVRIPSVFAASAIPGAISVRPPSAEATTALPNVFVFDCSSFSPSPPEWRGFRPGVWRETPGLGERHCNNSVRAEYRSSFFRSEAGSGLVMAGSGLKVSPMSAHWASLTCPIAIFHRMPGKRPFTFCSDIANTGKGKVRRGNQFTVFG
jgi:hypothetical protein